MRWQQRTRPDAVDFGAVTFSRMKITDLLVAEHRIFLDVFAQIERALPRLTTLAEAKTLARVIEGMLAGHADTETNLAYAALDHVLKDRERLDRLREEHDEIDARLSRVQTARDRGEARRLLKAALLATRRHFRFEEMTVFPLLEDVLQSEMLADLGTLWAERSPIRQSTA